AVSKIPAEQAERGKNAIDAQLQAARIGRSVKVGLVGNAVFAHARGHSCIQAYARGQPVVGIFANECRRDGGLPRLNLVSTGIAQGYKLSCALEIIVYAVNGSGVGVAMNRRGAARRCLAGAGLHKLDRRGLATRGAIATAGGDKRKAICLPGEAFHRAHWGIRGPVVDLRFDYDRCGAAEAGLGIVTVTEYVELGVGPETLEIEHAFLPPRATLPA